PYARHRHARWRPAARQAHRAYRQSRSSAQLVHALDDLAGDIKLRFDIDHRAALKNQVVVAFLDHFLDGLVQLRLELLKHVAVSRSLRLIELLGEELEITGLLLELKLKTLALGLLHLVAVLAETILDALGIVFQSDRKSTRLNSSHVKISYAV